MQTHVIMIFVGRRTALRIFPGMHGILTVKIIIKGVCMKSLNFLDWIVLILLIIGGINWGLIGLFNFNLVETIFSNMPIITRIVYIIVGVCAIYAIIMLARKSAKQI